MRYIGYDELEPGQGYPKMTESFEDGPYPHQKTIVWFLRHGNVECVQASRERDVFTGKWIPTEVLVMSSEDFYWSNELAYYVERYNLRLPKDFEEHILQAVRKRAGKDK